MFVDDRAHPPSLEPGAYFEPASYAAEVRAALEPGWHLVAPRSHLARHGDWVATDLVGLPVVARNEQGTLVAFVNVCSHRQALLCSDGRGNCATLRCQYHGWEYGADGTLSRLPDGPSFKGFKASSTRLTPLRIDTLGELVYVTADSRAPALLEWLGPLADELRPFYERPLEVLWSTAEEHSVNWKVIVENAVESYHVPMVHPETFARYRDPSLHDHRIEATFTRYADREPWRTTLSGTGMEILARVLLPNATNQRFTHAHRFPAQLYYFGDLYCDFAVVTPLGPTRSRVSSVGFAPARLRSQLLRPLRRAWTTVIARQVSRISAEDRGVWAAVQRGVMHAQPGQGVLSAREERVHAFQSWLRSQLGDDANCAAPPRRGGRG